MTYAEGKREYDIMTAATALRDAQASGNGTIDTDMLCEAIMILDDIIKIEFGARKENRLNGNA